MAKKRSPEEGERVSEQRLELARTRIREALQLMPSGFPENKKVKGVGRRIAQVIKREFAATGGALNPDFLIWKGPADSHNMCVASRAAAMNWDQLIDRTNQDLHDKTAAEPLLALLQAGASTQMGFMNILDWAVSCACANNNGEAVRALIKAGAHPDGFMRGNERSGDTIANAALIIVAHGGQPSALSALKEAGANMKHPDIAAFVLNGLRAVEHFQEYFGNNASPEARTAQLLEWLAPLPQRLAVLEQAGIDTTVIKEHYAPYLKQLPSVQYGLSPEHAISTGSSVHGGTIKEAPVPYLG